MTWIPTTVFHPLWVLIPYGLLYLAGQHKYIKSTVKLEDSVKMRGRHQTESRERTHLLFGLCRTYTTYSDVKIRCGKSQNAGFVSCSCLRQLTSFTSASQA